MHGRLGNQLFQYAAARSLQEKTGQIIVAGFSRVEGANTEGVVGWENSLKFFKIKNIAIYDGDIFDTIPTWKKAIGFLYAISYRPVMRNMKRWYEYQYKVAPFLDKIGIRWIANGFYPYKYEKSKDIFLNGSFEAKEYFQEIRDLLLQEIEPIEERLLSNKELYKLIEESNSVCLSVRHFCLNGYQKRLYDVCDYEFYKKAISIMKEKVDNPVFVVFSDDIEWAKKNLKLSTKEFIFETENNPIWEKLRLMYSCKHFIIPNSTFAWWAQYLGRYEDKRVIGPSKWFNNDFDSPLIEDAWIKI